MLSSDERKEESYEAQESGELSQLATGAMCRECGRDSQVPQDLPTGGCLRQLRVVVEVQRLQRTAGSERQR